MFKGIICLVLVTLVSAGVYRGRYRHDTGWWQNECERVDAANQLAVARMRLENADHGFDPSKLEAALIERSAIEIRVAELLQQQRKMGGIIEQARVELANFRKERLKQLRSLAAGSHWLEFLAADERRFYDAKLIAIDDAGVTLRHRDGSVRLGYRDLTEAQRRALGLEEDAGMAARQKERKETLAYETWIEEELEIARVEEERADTLQETSRPERSRRSMVMLSQVAPASTLSKPGRKLGSGTRYVRSRNTSFYYYNYHVPRTYNRYHRVMAGPLLPEPRPIPTVPSSTVPTP